MPDVSGTSYAAPFVPLPGSVTVSTALLPAARRGVDRPLRIDDAGALDAVHDHVVRLLGDAGAAAAVVADLALRAGHRVDDGAAGPTRAQLLRQAHARMATELRVAPRSPLLERLAGDHVLGATLVTAMAIPGRAGAALLDLTARHGLGLADAAELVGLDQRTAAATRTEALRQVRARLADAGVGQDVDVTAALAELPVVSAAPELNNLFAPAARATGRPVPSALAWLGTAVVAVATVGALAVALPPLTDATTGDAPVVVAERVSDTPAARQLATPGDDVPADGVEQLVVQTPERDESASESALDEQGAEPAPSPEPSPEPEPTPEEDDNGAPEEPEDPEPSPEPSNPLDLDLLNP